MFGKKNTQSDLGGQAAVAYVHTMQEDLDAIKSGAQPESIATVPQSGAATSTAFGVPSEPIAAAPSQSGFPSSPEASSSEALSFAPEAPSEQPAPQGTFATAAAPSDLPFGGSLPSDAAPQAQSAPSPAGQPFAATDPTQGLSTPATAEGAPPFGAPAASFDTAPGDSPITQEVSRLRAEEGELLLDDDAPRERGGIGRVIIVIAVVILVLSGLAAAAFFFFSGGSAPVEEQPVTIGGGVAVEDVVPDTPTEATPPVDTPVDPTPPLSVTPSQQYSEDLPNYFPVDAASPTAGTEVAASLQGAVTAIQTQQPRQPVEFLVTDARNAPVPFSAFADLTSMSIPPEVAAILGETYILYLYDDAGTVRAGLSIDLSTTPAQAQTVLQANEGSFINAVTPLFLGNIVEFPTEPFSDSTHGTTDIRFANINSAKTLSVDYAVVDNTLVIGTSKDTIRAIIDKRATQAPSGDVNGAL